MITSPSTPRPSLRALAGLMALGDLGFAFAVWRRWRITTRLLGPHEDDLSRWSLGVIAAYTVAQGVIALRPTPAGARAFAALRATLIGGDLALAFGGRTVDRRLLLPVVALNASLAGAAWRTAPPQRPDHDHHFWNQTREDSHA